VRLVLLGGAPGIGKTSVARAVLTHHAGAVDEFPLLQAIDVDALWLHQPWRVDDVMRGLVAENLSALLGNAHRAGVEVALVAWTFHDEELRRVVIDAAPPHSPVVSVQLVAEVEVWRARFAADVTRGGVTEFYEERFTAAQAMNADVRIDVSRLSVDRAALEVAALTTSVRPLP